MLQYRLTSQRGLSFSGRHIRRRFLTNSKSRVADIQKTPSTPTDIVTEVPHAPKPSIIIDVPSPLWYHRIGPVQDFFVWFSRVQRRRPLTVTLATSLTTYLAGDLLAQEIGCEPYDYTRTLRMLLIGAVASIPGYKWFMFLGSHFNYTSTLRTITTKVLIQQFFFAPLFNIYFFSLQAVLAGASFSDVAKRVKLTVPESIVSSAKFWPAVTALNFTIIPAHLRFAFSGIFAVVWQTYMSFLNRSQERVEPMGTLLEEAKVRVEEIVDELTPDDS